LQPKIWEEVIIAALGEQLRDIVSKYDTVVGVSISIRDRDDIVQVWNDNSEVAEAITEQLINRVKSLYPQCSGYLNAYYKRE